MVLEFGRREIEPGPHRLDTRQDDDLRADLSQLHADQLHDGHPGLGGEGLDPEPEQRGEHAQEDQADQNGHTHDNPENNVARLRSLCCQQCKTHHHDSPFVCSCMSID